jgi:hypothetical protein
MHCVGCDHPLYPPPDGKPGELQCWNRQCHFHEARFQQPKLNVPASVSIES